MKPADLLAWFEEVDARSLGAAVDEGSGYRYYPGDLSLQWVADAESALQQVFPERHPIRKQWGERLAGTKGNGWEVRRAYTIDALRAIFRSATGQLKAGRLSTLIDGIRAEDALELLDQADALAASKHHVAGAVIAGGALETTLRHLCERGAVLPEGPGSIAKYEKALAQARNKGAEVISQSDGKQVVAWGGLRNDAAHDPVSFGETQTVADVQRMIAGIRAFVGKYE